MDNLESNKMLAKYAGYDIQGNIDNDLFLFAKHDKMYCFKYAPDKDWNQLMEIAKEIKKRNPELTIVIHWEPCFHPSCSIYNASETIYIHNECDIMEQAIYRTVSAFVRMQPPRQGTL